MATSWNGWCWQLGVTSLLAMGGGLSPIADSGDCALAQITPDGTLGAESSVVTPTNIDGLSTERIDGGATRGANLFHSFDQFSVPTGSAAYFNNALNIQNIISRVTGGSISNIDGLIRANGTANLFLLNPNGIIFGPNASLNIGGSFLGSTASSINFADGTQFSATASQASPLLTINVPIGLQFGETAGSILNQSQATNSSGVRVGLAVQPGKTLALVGGDVRLDSGAMLAPGGRVELGGLAASGTVGLSMNNNLMNLSLPEGVARADVSLTNRGSNTATASNGGNIAINARNIDISGGSSLDGGLAIGLGFPSAQAGDISLNATGAIDINNGFIRNTVGTGAVGRGGNINITAGSLAVTNGAQLSASNRGQGDGGSVNIYARDTASFDGVSSNGSPAGVFSSVLNEAVGNGGDINITTGSLAVTNGAQLSASTLGRGNGGSVNINARDTVSFDGVSINRSSGGAFSTVLDSAMGNGGNINITTGSLAVTNGAQLSASNRGRGNGGSVNINARDTVSFDGVGSNGFSSTAVSSVGSRAMGNGANINITARLLAVTNGARLNASTLGRGNGGSVNINARDTVSFDGVGSNGFSSGAFSTVDAGAVGNGGPINITAGSLAVRNGAQLSASNRGQGNGGNITLIANTLEAIDGGQILTTSRSSGNAGRITLNVSDSVTLAGSDRTYNARLAVFGEGRVSGAGSASGLFASTDANSTGQGGDITIATEEFSGRDGAEVTVSSLGTGNAGNLEVVAGSIRLEDQGRLRADSSGEQGNIILRSQDLVLRRGSSITTNATGTATGGNITIDTGVITALENENSDISANAEQAFGGRVRINAQSIFGTEFRNQQTSLSDITASSNLGSEFSGTVEIDTASLNRNLQVIVLPTGQVVVSSTPFVELTGSLIAQGCAALGENEFIVTGRGGLPPNPSDPLSSDTVWSDLRYRTQLTENRPSESATQPTNPTVEPLVEAQGWVINNKGEVVLTAQAPNVTPHIPWMTPATCHTPELGS